MIPAKTMPTVSVPLMFVLTRLSFEAFGVNEWSARIVQAVCGVVAVPVSYLLFSRVSCRSLGWLGALLIALSPWHVFHSQEARFYSILFLFGGVAAWSFYLGLEHGSRAWMFCSALFLFLAVLTHTSAVFVGAALVTYPIALWILPFEKPVGLCWRTMRWFVLPLVVGGLLMTPLILYVLNHWGSREEEGYTALHIVIALLYNFTTPLMAIAGFGLIESLRRRERLGLFAAIYGGMPLMLLFVAILVLKAGMGPRYLLSSLPAYFLLAAYGGVQILRYIGDKSRWLAAGLIAMMLLSPLPQLLSYYVDGDRGDFRRAATFLKENAQPDDEVLAPQSPYTLKYYLGRQVQLLRVSSDALRQLEQPSDATRWLVVIAERTGFNKDKDRLLERWLLQHGRLVYEYRPGQFDRHVHDIRVYKL
jgi:hypothetical protein